MESVNDRAETEMENELFVPIYSNSNLNRSSNDYFEDHSTGGASSGGGGSPVGGSSSPRLSCGCPKFQPRLPDMQSTVASVSLSHTVVQDPNQVLASMPKFHKTTEERLFLLDVWLRRPALYYTGELIHAFINAFSPIKVPAGQLLIRERDTVTRCYIVYKGQLRLQKCHPAPCSLQFQTGLLETGAELFYDPLHFRQPSPWSCLAVEDTLLFSLSLKDLVNLTAALNEIRRGAFLDCLRAIKYFRPLAAKDLHALAESWDEPMQTFDYEAGFLLLEQGAVPTHLYYILNGCVELTDGRLSVRRGPGQTVCAQALLQLPSPYTATVAELSTLVGLEVQLCARTLRESLDGDPDWQARTTEELRAELVQEELEASELLGAAKDASAAMDIEAAEAAAAAEAAEARQRTNLQAIHRRSVLRLCRVPQLRGLLRPTELDGLLSDKVQKSTHILVRQKNDCLYSAGSDYAKYVYVVLEGELRETAPDGPEGSHALIRVVRRGSCACTESLLLLSACLCPRSAYANTACTAVALDVDAMEEAICRTFISVMKRRGETFRQCVGAQFASPDAAAELAFRDEIFPRDVVSSDFNLSGHDEMAFKALAVLQLVVVQLQLLMEPLGEEVLSATEVRSLRHCHRAVILGGGRSGSSRYDAGETVVTEEESKRRILYFVVSGEALVTHARGSRPAPEGGVERAEVRGAGSLLCPEQLFLPTVCCYEARAARDGTKVALVNQHVLETAMGCQFRDVFLRQPDNFQEFLAGRYPSLTEQEIQQLASSSEPSGAEPSTESQNRKAGRVYAFGLEALLCHQQLGRLFTDEELQRMRSAPPNVIPCIVEKRPNQSIFLEGIDQIANLYVVYTGRVTTTMTPGPNRPKHLLETHQPGDLLGSEGLFRTGSRSTSAYAACASELIVVIVDKLEAAIGSTIAEVLARHPDTMRAVFRRIFPPGMPLPRDGWRPGVSPQVLLAEDEAAAAQQPLDGGGARTDERRLLRGRHLRAEAQILREASGGRTSSKFDDDKMLEILQLH